MHDIARSAFPWRPVALLLAAAALIGFASLGQRDVWAPDEPKYALVAKEMIETGQFFLPHVNGEPYPDKPPLLFWLIAASSFVTGGVGQPAAVLPSVLSALLALLGTARLAHALSRGNRLATVLAPALLAISYRFFQNATCGQIDMLLTATEVWAFLWLVEGAGTLTGSPARPSRLVLAFLAMGLGTLSKGPVAILMPVGGLLLGAWIAGLRPPWFVLRRGLAWLAFAAPLLVWLVPAAVVALDGSHGTWLHDLLFKQTVVRYASSWHHHAPFWYFFAVPWYDFFPTSLLIPAALAGLWRRDAEPEERRVLRFLAGAVLFAIVFFSIPSGKRGLYILPTYPILATWLAIELERRLARVPRLLTWPRIAAGVLAVIGLAAVPALLVVAPDKLAARGVDAPVVPAAVAMAVIGLGALTASLLPRAWPRVLLGPALGFALLYLGVVTLVNPVVDRSRSARIFVEEVRARAVPEATPGMVDFRSQFGLYAGRMIAAATTDDAALREIAARLAGEAPFWVVMKAELRRLVDEHLPEGFEPLVLHERNVGDDHYIVLASPSTPRSAPPTSALSP